MQEPTPPTAETAQEAQAIHRAEHSARMTRLWQDPEWRESLVGKMKANRAKERTKQKLRDALLDAAREQAKRTGIAPQWAPRRVAALQTDGTTVKFESVRQCAAHYGIKESNMRAILKFGRTWNGIKFVTA